MHKKLESTSAKTLVNLGALTETVNLIKPHKIPHSHRYQSYKIHESLPGKLGKTLYILDLPLPPDLP